MRYELEEIGEEVSYDKLESKLEDLIANEIKKDKQQVIIPPGGCIYEDDFVACNFVIDHIPGAIVVTIQDIPKEKKVYLKHGVIFYKCEPKK